MLEKIFSNRIRCFLRNLTVKTLLVFIACIWGLAGFNSPTLGAESKRVLVLNSYHKGYAWTDKLIKGIETVMNTSEIPVSLHIEYMDTKRISDEKHYKNLFELYRHKLVPRKFDLIISSDDNAFRFLLKYRSELFPGIPIVFCGLNRFKDSMLVGQDDITGVVEGIDFKGTIDLALELQPNIKNVVVVTDGTKTGVNLARGMRKIIPQMKDRVNFSFFLMTELTMQELLDKLNGLGSDSIMIPLGQYRDKAGNVFSLKESMALITNNVPIYVLQDIKLGYGTLGGKVVSGFAQGEMAAQMALRVLKGESPGNIPIVKQSPNRYMFDHEQVIRHGIKLSDLPTGSIVLNIPFSFYEEYKPLIWTAVAVIVVLLLLVFFLFRNIMYRKRTDEELRESEERFRAIATNTPDHILIQDKDLRYVWVLNPQLGLTENDMIGKTDFDFLSEEDAAILTGLKKKVLGTGNPEFVKVPLISLKGDVQHFEGSYVPKHDQEGKIDGLIGYFRNVSERVKSEEALKESEKRYRNLLENVLVGVYQVTLDGKFLFANQKMAEMFGYSSYEEFEAVSSVADLYARPGERTKVVDEIINKGFIIDEVEFRRKDGQNIWVKLHTRKTINKEGTIILEGLMEDVTEKRNLEDQLHRAQKMEAMGLMAGGVAHDLNNILSGIVSYPELLLLDLPEDSPLRKPIKTIQESGMRAADVVEDLLTIARGVATSKEPLKLNTLITEYLGSAEYEKLEKTHSFVSYRTELDPDLLNMSGSPTHIKKILMNLVANATEAIEGSGVVTISTTTQYLDEPLKGYEDVRIGEYTVLKVSDDGSGISPEDLERIFEPFYTKKMMGRSGTGLGLAVVWNCMQDHNGYINVRSSEKGTVFELYFSVTREEVAAEGEEVPLEDYLGHGERVLVVDDEERQRQIASGILTRLGYNAETVSSGEAAIEYVKEHPVDLIVLDM